MKRYRIIGKSKQMRSVALFDPDQGKDVQHKIVSGKTIDVTEAQLTFHVERQEALGILRVVELEEEIVEAPPAPEPEPEPEPEVVPWPEEEKEEAPEKDAESESKPKKRAKSRRKVKIDLDEDDES